MMIIGDVRRVVGGQQHWGQRPQLNGSGVESSCEKKAGEKVVKGQLNPKKLSRKEDSRTGDTFGDSHMTNKASLKKSRTGKRRVKRGLKNGRAPGRRDSRELCEIFGEGTIQGIRFLHAAISEDIEGG